jgi:hypothetical protein
MPGATALGGGGFQVRGWRPGAGWVRVDPPDEGALGRDGGIKDLDLATLIAVDARRSFARVEVLDADGEVRVTVDRSGASAPHRAPEKIPASALPFLAAAMRIELGGIPASAHEWQKGRHQGRSVKHPMGADPGERPEDLCIRNLPDADARVRARSAAEMARLMCAALVEIVDAARTCGFYSQAPSHPMAGCGCGHCLALRALVRVEGGGRCILCACTEDDACEDGCAWTSPERICCDAHDDEMIAAAERHFHAASGRDRRG